MCFSMYNLFIFPQEIIVSFGKIKKKIKILK
jgi:hypothetical protein